MAGVEKGLVQSGPARGGCEGCPLAGGCASCPKRTPTQEVSSDIKFSRLESLTENFKGLLPRSTIFFNASGEILMRLKEKICSICKEASSTCSHSKSKTGALAVA
ncbi:hypothetical protein M1437_03725 [Patescibacteria group bacterium]|nr:hypothetical protein [Patescibacteria group bacterium]